MQLLVNYYKLFIISAWNEKRYVHSLLFPIRRRLEGLHGAKRKTAVLESEVLCFVYS